MINHYHTLNSTHSYHHLINKQLSLFFLVFANLIDNKNKMKRTKQQQTIISLCSKRQSLQQDRLTGVHQNEWNPPLQTVDGNHSRSFFANMKAELSNIRSDYERLIQREDKTSSLTIKEKQMIQQKTAYRTAEKAKSYISYKQEDRYLT